MHSISSLLVVLIAVVAGVIAAPTTTSNIQCAATGRRSGSLYAGDYYYGGMADKLAYKRVTQKSGTTALWVVSAADADAKPFIIAQRLACNATSLGYVSNHTVFNAPTPVKLITDVVIDGQTHCVGLNAHHTTAPTSTDSKTHVILTPCQQADNAYAQSNQFWSQTWKYANLLPLVGPWPVPHKDAVNGPTWPIYPPSASGAEPHAYRAGPFQKGAEAETTYKSFAIE